MTGADAQAAYASLYAPSVAEIASGLADVADALQARMHVLAQDPSASGAEQLARDAAGLQALAMKLVLACRREGRS